MQSSARQAASLDLQRKQSALTILQPLLDSLQHYRAIVSRSRLEHVPAWYEDVRANYAK